MLLHKPVLTQAGDGRKKAGQTGRGAQCMPVGNKEALLPDSLPGPQQQDLVETGIAGRMQRDLPISAFCTGQIGMFPCFSLIEAEGRGLSDSRHWDQSAHALST